MTRVVAALAAVALAVAPLAGQPPTLDEVLARAGRYVVQYQQRLAGIVAEEHYRQQVLRMGRTGRTGREFRDLKSDVLLVKVASAEQWLQFRDVFEVDRKPIRDRDERLAKLFISAHPDARAQAENIQQESARYNIGPVWRTINIPIMALLFFEPSGQALIEFKREKAGNLNRFAGLAQVDNVWLVSFKETSDQTLVRGANSRPMPSHGRAWIDGATGRVLRTEQITQDPQVRAVIDVTYAAQEGLDLLVPAEMRESYVVNRTETRIDGRATYGRFRQFTVSTTEKPKGPEGR